MSYRTYVNDVQIFGNGEYLEPWAEYLKAQNIQISEDGCYRGELTDFEGALKAIERCTELKKQEAEQYRKENLPLARKRLERRPDSLRLQVDVRCLDGGFGDLGYMFLPGERMDTSLFDTCWEAVTSAYCFLPFQFWLACRDLLEPVRECCQDENGAYRIHRFRLKPGMAIPVNAG